MTWLLTHSGKHFDLIDPQPDTIDILDIAKGLSREARWAGQTNDFYSVAQHSVLTSHIVPDEFELEALLHDASEAYIKDIPRPLKLLLPDYRHVEARVQGAIRARFGLPTEQSQHVSEADVILLATERRDLMPHDASEWPLLYGIKPMNKRLQALNSNHAEMMFLQRFQEVWQQ
jgi:uncharacterized protein